MNYQEYIVSNAWKAKRVSILEKRQRCQRCGLLRNLCKFFYGRDLNLHHLTYERLGHELDSDIQVLCVACHEIVEHFILEEKNSTKRTFMGFPVKEIKCTRCGDILMFSHGTVDRHWRDTPPIVYVSKGCECEEEEWMSKIEIYA